MEWGAEFDRNGAKLAFGREGAHSRNRVLHAQGDSTGHEIARTLQRKAASLPNIEFRSFEVCTDLMLGADGVTGAELCDSAGEAVTVRARATLLATGGLGNLFLNTTNPDVATGDGVALAWRAGAEISDIEFVQFHPTALDLEGAPRFLLSEALRGEGAVLVNSRGERFMEGVHPLKELAPRDVVARAILAQSRSGPVYLDISSRGPEFVSRRFPRVYQTCLKYGIDLGREPAPVAPAAHYGMGGVRTDLQGRTSLARLFAAGEAACTGVHGANRLASNSLLEGVVFGARAGRAMRECDTAPSRESAKPARGAGLEWPGGTDASELRRLAWRQCGIVRDAAGLRAACGSLAETQKAAAFRSELAQARNMQQVLLLIARSALAREESRGAHFRSDYPVKRAEFEKHSVARADAEIEFQ